MGKLIVIVLIVVGVIAGYFLLTKKPQDVPTPPANNNSAESVPQSSQIAGNYKVFNKEEYKTALNNDQVVVLYFFANWCPICRDQEPTNKEVFESLSDDPEVVGFRVNILDSEETAETKALASEFEVTYQHTYVILDKNGEVSYKYTGPLSFEAIKEKILEAK